MAQLNKILKSQEGSQVWGADMLSVETEWTAGIPRGDEMSTSQ